MPESQLGKLQIIQNAGAVIRLELRNTHQLPLASSTFLSYNGYQFNVRSHLNSVTYSFVCIIWPNHIYKKVHTCKKSQIITKKSFRMSSFGTTYKVQRAFPIEYRSDDVMAICYSIVMVLNKRSLHQASGSGLEPGTGIVSNRCDH